MIRSIFVSVVIGVVMLVNNSFGIPSRDIIPIGQGLNNFFVNSGDIVYDFGGPGNYTGCFCYTTTVLRAPGSVISLDFFEFAMLAPTDHITIHDGDGTTAPIIYTNRDGDFTTADRTFEKFVETNGSSVIQASSGSITINFAAGFSLGGRERDKGYAATITTTPCFDTWNLTGVIDDGKYPANGEIRMTGSILSGSDVIAQSLSESITIIPEFTVQNSATLEINNTGCN